MSNNKNKPKPKNCPEKPEKHFLIQTENFHPTVLKHLNGQEDLLTFRQLQGELAKYYRFLGNAETIDKQQDITVKVKLSSDDNSRKLSTIAINTTKKNCAMSEAIINDVFLKHLHNALEEVKYICLSTILEDIKEVPINGTVKQLFEIKKTLTEN